MTFSSESLTFDSNTVTNLCRLPRKNFLNPSIFEQKRTSKLWPFYRQWSPLKQFSISDSLQWYTKW